MDLSLADEQGDQQQSNQQPSNQQQSNQQQQQEHQQQQQNQQQQQQNQQPPYTLPGIFHYLQYEWHRFEVERQEWEVEKAELSARIALLQGEKKSHENLKHDLIRRIKMLEYCLRMERAKFHKLKHGTDPPPIENLNQSQQGDDSSQKVQGSTNSNSNSSTITYGRELLRHYLQEIGYTETIIDLRSNRVRSLLGIVDDQTSDPSQSLCPSPQKNDAIDIADLACGQEIADLACSQEIADIACGQEIADLARGQDIGDLASLTQLESDISSDEEQRKHWTARYRLQSHYDCVRALRFSETDSLLVTASEDETIKLWHLSGPSSTSGKTKQPNLPPSINTMNNIEGPTLDIEPLHTYRGHTSRVLSITMRANHIFSGAQNGELIMWRIVSDPASADQYGKFDSSQLVCKFVGHNDAVWSVETVDQPKSDPILCSASADLTIKLWTTSGENTSPIGVIQLDSSPTCLARIPLYNVGHAGADLAVSSSDGKIRLYDIVSHLNHTESNTQPTATFECDQPHRINSIVIHPTLPHMASADSNHDIKFWDLKTGECKSTMAAHLDEVTSLACDPSGKYLLSASHDCSVRLWLFEEKACIQEIASHRKKFDEGIFAVAFHPSLSHFATAGADGLAKVFV